MNLRLLAAIAFALALVSFVASFEPAIHKLYYIAKGV